MFDLLIYFVGSDREVRMIATDIPNNRGELSDIQALQA